MSKQSVSQVIQRAVGDGAFRRQLQQDPTSALRGYDLSGEERAAITTGDPSRLSALGVDQRMSKAFSLGGAGDLNASVSPGDTGTATGAFIEEASTAAHGSVSPGFGGGLDGSVDAGGTGTSGAVDAGGTGTSGAVDAGGTGTEGALDPGGTGTSGALDPGGTGTSGALDPGGTGMEGAVDPGTDDGTGAVDDGGHALGGGGPHLM